MRALLIASFVLMSGAFTFSVISPPMRKRAARRMGPGRPLTRSQRQVLWLHLGICLGVSLTVAAAVLTSIIDGLS